MATYHRPGDPVAEVPHKDAGETPKSAQGQSIRQYDKYDTTILNGTPPKYRPRQERTAMARKRPPEVVSSPSHSQLCVSHNRVVDEMETNHPEKVLSYP